VNYMNKDEYAILNLAQQNLFGILMRCLDCLFKMFGMIFRQSILRLPNGLATLPKNRLHCLTGSSKRAASLTARYWQNPPFSFL